MSMRSGGFELTKLAYTRLEDNLIRHRGFILYLTRFTRHQVPGWAIARACCQFSACAYKLLGIGQCYHSTYIRVVRISD